jgi:hypothetical protein
MNNQNAQASVPLLFSKKMNSDGWVLICRGKSKSWCERLSESLVVEAMKRAVEQGNVFLTSF